MKKIINHPDDAVREMLSGLCAANKDKLVYIEEKNIVMRKVVDSSRVAVIAGSGSGHEPDQAGYVGKGMLTAAVPGPIFAAPRRRDL